MMRALSALLLSLVLAMTSVTLAVARGQPPGVAEMVICSDGAAVSVVVDASGNPVQAHHHCPDCLTVLALGGMAPPAPRALPSAVADLRPPFASSVTLARPVLAASPRGPPVRA